jgi:uncharacterized protein (DUF1499 family)
MMKKAVLSFLLGIFSLAGCTSPGTPGIGVLDGKLKPCPASPNCVSSQGSGERHHMEAIPYTTTGNEARVRLRNVIKGMEGSSIIMEKDDYIHAEYRSALFGFIDDVEFYLDDTRKLIHFRSASRVGYYDFGVNRKRMEAIRKKFLAP